jgi:hypothetical protein
MKVKKFDNIWTMGLILFGAIMLFFFIAKLFFPKWVVCVAETPQIVEFGTFIDSNIWAYHLFNGATSFLLMYFYTCACCRIEKFDILECGILIINIVISIPISIFIPNFAFAYNIMGYIIMPLILTIKRKLDDFKIFYSLCISFLSTTICQTFSLEIRGINTIISYPNTATYFILLIDLYICNILLYLYFNFKKGDYKNG